MKRVILLCLLTTLTACATSRSNQEREEACRTPLYKPVVDLYGVQGCVLVLIENDRQHDLALANMLSSGTHHSMQPIPTPQMTNYAQGQPVYNSSQCIGAVVNGVCNGSTMGGPIGTCHGEMLNGQCTGPMF